MNRSERQELARSTAAIVAAGGYQSAGGWVELAGLTDIARHDTHLHLPDEPLSPAGSASEADAPSTTVEVTGETTLAAAHRLSTTFGEPPAALNFASAKHPGGGWTSGALAQEETLARASALVTCLDEVPEYYEHHKAQHHPLYTDRVICTPGVPVFRHDDGTLLDAPHPVTFLTAAAPNAGALAARTDWDGDLAGALRRRAQRVLAVAAAHGHPALVLGAWGCGVFRNDPRMVALTFADLLSSTFARSFRHVTFAVHDPHPAAPNRAAFCDALRPLTG